MNQNQESPVITRYIESKRCLKLEDYNNDFDSIMSVIRKYKKVDKKTRILEVGSGTGWFQLLCLKNGLNCKGIEISPQLIAFSYSFGEKYGMKPDIELGNIEECDIGKSKYDVIIASSVFEHIEYWQKAMVNVFNALKKKGLFYFVSTNKYSLSNSGEYTIPFYGLLPSKVREWLLVKREGESIKRLGLDYNQFNYFQLKKFFNRLGFSKIHDYTEFLNTTDFTSAWRRLLFNSFKHYRPLKILGLLFSPVTFFVCEK